MPKRHTDNPYLTLNSHPVSEILIKFALDNLTGKIMDFGGATGGYSKKLIDFGLDPVCVDINMPYLKRALPLSCVASDTRIPFKPDSFDGAICFDVLEHLNKPIEALKELKRCVKGKLIVSVPNCGGTEQLAKYGLTYDHYMATDHCNYFDRNSLQKLLKEFYSDVKIMEIFPVEHFLYRPAANTAGWLFYKMLKAQLKVYRNLGLIRHLFYDHLVAICGSHAN